MNYARQQNILSGKDLTLVQFLNCFDFEKDHDKEEMIQWIQNLQILQQYSFKKLCKLWRKLGSKDNFVWNYLLGVLGHSDKITDPGFPLDHIVYPNIYVRSNINSVRKENEYIAYYMKDSDIFEILYYNFYKDAHGDKSDLYFKIVIRSIVSGEILETDFIRLQKTCYDPNSEFSKFRLKIKESSFKSYLNTSNIHLIGQNQKEELKDCESNVSNDYITSLDPDTEILVKNHEHPLSKKSYQSAICHIVLEGKCLSLANKSASSENVYFKCVFPDCDFKMCALCTPKYYISSKSPLNLKRVDTSSKLVHYF